MVSSKGPLANAKPGEIRKEVRSSTLQLTFRHHPLTSSKIYANGAIITQSARILTVIPVEVLHRIFALLSLASSVALSLTCKDFAAHADHVRDHTQLLFTNAETAKQIASGKPPKKLPSANTRPKAPIHSKPAKLAMLILLKPWFPPDLALCYRCLKYKPRSVGRWTTSEEITRSGLATQRAIALGQKCPVCADWIAIQRGKDLDGYGKLVQGVKKYVKYGV